MQILTQSLDLTTTLFPRAIFEDIKKTLFDRDIIVLSGARQVGKTSLMHLLYRFLISEQRATTERIFFFDLEDVQTLEEIDSMQFTDFARHVGKGAANERVFVFIDEIQYLKEPSSFLKILHDHYPQIKLIVSGSSSLALRRKFKDALTGRKHVFAVNGLSFQEYLAFTKSSCVKQKNAFETFTHRTLPTDGPLCERAFEDFALFGGYPEVALIADKEKKADKLREIYSSYVRKDIKDLMRIENVAGFNALAQLLAHQIGNLASIDELANSAGLSRDTTSKYLLILENTFVVNFVYPYFTNKRKEITKMPKVYFKDMGLRHVITRNLSDIAVRGDKGAIIENVVYGELSNFLGENGEVKFWRTQAKQEVDFILDAEEIVPVEVKYQSFSSPRVPSGIKRFISAYHPPRAVVVTKDFSGIAEYDGADVCFIPAWSV